MDFWDDLSIRDHRVERGTTEWSLEVMDETLLLSTPINMLAHHTPYGFLPLRVTYQEQHARLHYDLQGLIPLEDIVRRGMTDRRWEQVLCSISNRLRMCPEYLLRAEEVLLEPAHLWTKTDGGEVWVAYVPIARFAVVKTPWQQWNRFCSWLISNGCPRQQVLRVSAQQWESASFTHRLWMEQLQNDHLITMEETSVASEALTATSDSGKKPFWEVCKQLWKPARSELPTACTVVSEREKIVPLPVVDRTATLLTHDQTVVLSAIKKLQLRMSLEGGGAAIDLSITNSPFYIGRDASSVHYVVAHPTTSRKQIVFEWIEGQWKVQDCGSINGTWLNEQRMSSGHALSIVPGDRLRIPGAHIWAISNESEAHETFFAH